MEDAVEEDLGRGQRKKFLSYKIKRAANVKPSSTLPMSLYHEVMEPEPTTQSVAEHAPPQSGAHTDASSIAAQQNPVPLHSKTTTTPPNAFGLYKKYTVYSDDVPHDPDSSVLPSDL